MVHNDETIVAQATAIGTGSIGVVRVSGGSVAAIAQTILKKKIQPRQAVYTNFYDQNNNVLDKGIALFFPKPNSFTGEDTLELQGHGGTIVINMIIESILATKKARMAEPGEFSQRSFLNNKMDLAQAEAVVKLINATSKTAAKNAINSVNGELSKLVNQIKAQIVHLRVQVEAMIDFPDEDIDVDLTKDKMNTALSQITEDLNTLINQSEQSSLINDGIKVAIIGKTNAGKSSLLNCLCEHEKAIVTDIEGTTRDCIDERIIIKGIPITIIDTAGFRKTTDSVEKIGISKSEKIIKEADIVLYLMDSNKSIAENKIPQHEDLVNCETKKIIFVQNKIDKLCSTTKYKDNTEQTVYISAKHKQGISKLKDKIAEAAGYQANIESTFSASARHVTALKNCLEHIEETHNHFNSYMMIDLASEELKLAHDNLGLITGKMHSDEMLGEIFSNFCIGK